MKRGKFIAVAVGILLTFPFWVSAENVTHLTFWPYPVGNWGNPEVVGELIASFEQAHPDIQVSVEYLDYATGDERVRNAIEEGSPPDVVMEGPERLVADWGKNGFLATVDDLFTPEAEREIYNLVKRACKEQEHYYMYPLCMSPHTMAINRDQFEEADALRYVNEKTHTWTCQGFVQAVQALYEHEKKDVAIVYCKDQGGDQGTRSLVNSLFGGSFTNDSHTQYILDTPENLEAFKLLVDLEGVRFAPDLNGGDVIGLFCRGELPMTFCWNVAQERIHQEVEFDILPMNFPGPEEPPLCTGIWGFGIFESRDAARMKAARLFIDYLCNDEAMKVKSVATSGFWPVKDVGTIYEDDALMQEYSVFIPYMGDYYQVTYGWPKARQAWANLLRSIAQGGDLAEAVGSFEVEANTAADQESMEAMMSRYGYVY